jgi:hypothetical protein
MTEENKQPEQKHFTHTTKLGGGPNPASILQKLTKAVNKANAEKYKGQIKSMTNVIPMRVEWDCNGQGQIVTALFLIDVLGNKVYDNQGIDITPSQIAQNVLASLKEQTEVTPIVPTADIIDVLNLKDELVGRIPHGSEPPKPRRGDTGRGRE